MLNIKKLPIETQAHLEEILAKNVDSLTKSEVRYLKARQGYLTRDQKDVFALVLDGQVEGNEDPTEDSHGNDEKKVIDPKLFKLEILRQMAKDAGIETKEEMTKKEIADMLNAR